MRVPQFCGGRACQCEVLAEATNMCSLLTPLHPLPLCRRRSLRFRRRRRRSRAADHNNDRDATGTGAGGRRAARRWPRTVLCARLLLCSAPPEGVPRFGGQQTGLPHAWWNSYTRTRDMWLHTRTECLSSHLTKESWRGVGITQWAPQNVSAPPADFLSELLLPMRFGLRLATLGRRTAISTCTVVTGASCYTTQPRQK